MKLQFLENLVADIGIVSSLYMLSLGPDITPTE